MGKRPLFVALVVVVVWIVCWHYIMPEKTPPDCQGVDMRLEGQVEDISGQGEKISITVRDVMGQGKFFCSGIKLYSSKGQNLFSEIKVGNIISFQGKIYSFSKPGNPGQFNEYQYYKEQGIQYRAFLQSLTITNRQYNKRKQWLYQWKSRFLSNLDKCLPEEEAGIVSAMVLGEKSGLTEEIKELYQKNGIAHILAISGLHITMIGAGIFFLLRKFLLPMKGAAAVSGILLILYGELTGFPIATKRAVFMMLCLFIGKLLGRRYDRMNALALSGLLQLILQPGALFQSGFLLSYGTVLGILLLVEPLTTFFKEKNRWWGIIAGALGIQLVTLPILLYFYYEISLYSVFINLIVLPFVSILITLSVAGIAGSFFSFYAGRFFFGVVHVILNYYQMICQKAGGLPLSRIIVGAPFLWQIALYYILLLIWCRLTDDEKKKRHIWILLTAIVLLFLPLQKNREMSITNLDVGQGDCTCIQFREKVILVDGGSSDVNETAKYRISKFLKYKGIKTIDMVFVTHSDSDHTSGILEILEDKEKMGFEIKSIVLPDIKKQDENYQLLERRCRQYGVAVKKMKRGDAISIGDFLIRCMHPDYSYEWENENDYSLVLSVEYGRFHGLLTGDLEEAGEKVIQGRVGKIDYLKVGHHGSKSSSSEAFLQELQPEISVISAGKNNRYGHPAREVIKRLKESGSQIYSTIEDGAVTVHSDGEKTTVETYK
ncbi:MAG: DNA internalization-related competence protein ComEC/Rec2 [Lachnospiraceae bacterium]|nr:DNA internalization-related competence protein ComEC/Rec2 [Lachnospiraceae bacterium]